MPPRRERGGRAAAVGATDPEEVRALRRQFQAFQEEFCTRTNVSTGDKSEEDQEEEIREEGKGEEGIFNQVEERIFRVITKFGKRPAIDVGVFSGNLKLDELIDWINELEEYFEYEDVRDPDTKDTEDFY